MVRAEDVTVRQVDPRAQPERQPAQATRQNGLITPEQVQATKEVARHVLREPFTRRPWVELAFFLVSGGLAVVGLAVVGVTMLAGIVLAITFVGLAILALSLRSARGLGGVMRHLARGMLGELVEDPEPAAGRPGFLGWLQTRLRDRVAWRAVGYLALKVPLTFFGVLVAISLWWDAFACLLHPLWRDGGGLPVWGLPLALFSPGVLDNGPHSFTDGVALFLFGIVFLLAAPWATRAFVNVDRLLMSSLLGPDPTAARLRTLEETRMQTVDASVATLRRIERDLHDGTQAQLVALAMRLGLAKEKLQDTEHVDLDRVRQLVDDAHRGAKEAIAELRDIARGIHPPALDIGLEGALATLAARSAVPTALSVELRARPTPAIEAIAYFCVAELLANVAQHADASRASVSCSENGSWLRLVVRDDGRGGALLSTVGSSSSGLAGLTERVRAVDGRLHIVSPAGGPTVVTVDLPLSA
jgi:signal transduction histidine kinase